MQTPQKNQEKHLESTWNDLRHWRVWRDLACLPLCILCRTNAAAVPKHSEAPPSSRAESLPHVDTCAKTCPPFSVLFVKLHEKIVEIYNILLILWTDGWFHSLSVKDTLWTVLLNLFWDHWSRFIEIQIPCATSKSCRRQQALSLLLNVFLQMNFLHCHQGAVMFYLHVKLTANHSSPVKLTF